MKSRTTTLLAIDLAKSTSMSSVLSPSQDRHFKVSFRNFAEEVFGGADATLEVSEGDGLFFSFPRATAAVESARQFQLQFDTWLESGDHPSSNFRIGGHMGELFSPTDGPPRGNAKDVAEALEGQAELGGVLLSGSIIHSLDNEHKLHDRISAEGRRDLRMLDFPLPVYSLGSHQ